MMYQLAEHLGKELLKHGLKLATVESCTGGGLSYWITSVSGSSQWYDCGFITYSNDAKNHLVGVHVTSIEKYGAVSEQVAREMAEGVLLKSSADISISITGIAGPTGAVFEKPVGTVWIALKRRHFNTQAHHFHFTGDRAIIREQAITQAFNLLIDLLGTTK